MAKILLKRLTRLSVGAGEYEVTSTFIHCWWECKMIKALWKTVWQFLTK